MREFETPVWGLKPQASSLACVACFLLGLRNTFLSVSKGKDFFVLSSKAFLWPQDG